MNAQSEQIIGKYRVHPVAAMFPLLDGEPFNPRNEIKDFPGHDAFGNNQRKNRKMNTIEDQTTTQSQAGYFERQAARFRLLPDEERAINRLRASKQSAEEGAFAKGKKDGAEFVVHRGDYAELERLRSWHDTEGWSHIDVTAADMANEMSDGDTDRSKDLLEILTEDAGRYIENEDYVRGFVDGALEKFEELEAKL